jgi:hypothetical protein
MMVERAPARADPLNPHGTDAAPVLPPLARVVLWMIGTLLSFSAMAARRGAHHGR